MRLDLGEPLRRPFLEVGFAVDAGSESGCAELGETLVQLSAEAAEVVEARITQCENRVPQLCERGSAVVGQRGEEGAAVVRGLAVAEGTRNDQKIRNVGETGDTQLVQRHRPHRAARCPQSLGTRSGEFFGVAGLRSPRDDDRCPDGFSCRSVRLGTSRVDARQQALDPRTLRRRERCRRRKHRNTAEITRVDPGEHAGQVDSFGLVEHRCLDVAETDHRRHTAGGVGDHLFRCRHLQQRDRTHLELG